LEIRILVRYLKKKQQVGYNFFLEIVREIFGDALRNIFFLWFKTFPRIYRIVFQFVLLKFLYIRKKRIFGSKPFRVYTGFVQNAYAEIFIRKKRIFGF